MKFYLSVLTLILLVQFNLQPANAQTGDHPPVGAGTLVQKLHVANHHERVVLRVKSISVGSVPIGNDAFLLSSEVVLAPMNTLTAEINPPETAEDLTFHSNVEVAATEKEIREIIQESKRKLQALDGREIFANSVINRVWIKWRNAHRPDSCEEKIEASLTFSVWDIGGVFSATQKRKVREDQKADCP